MPIGYRNPIIVRFQQVQSMAVRYSKDPRVDRTLRHSVRDGVAYSVMSGAGETYFSAFALFLKASAPQVAMLSVLPQLLGSLAQLLSAWLGARLSRRKPLILVGASLQALVWVPLVALPLSFPDLAIPLLLICVTFYHAAANLAVPVWISLMGDLVPERKRGRYFGRRTRLATMTAFISLVTAGVILHGFDARGWTVYGFLSLFLCASLARASSVYHLALMHEPEPIHHEPATMPPKFSLRLLRQSHAWRFTLFLALMQGAVAVAAPFFVVYMLRDLQFSYLQFMAITGTAVLVQFLALNMWGRISDAFGNRLILVTTGSFLPLLPALWLIAEKFWYLMAIQVISGFVWAGFSLSAGNFLYDLIPGQRRTRYMALHNVFVALVIFGGGMLGALLSRSLPPLMESIGLHWAWGGSVLLGVFAISALLRVLVAMLFLPRLEEVRKPRRAMSARQLVFRVTRFSAFSGLLYEVVTMFRRRPEDEDN
jgi:MFS family permease